MNNKKLFCLLITVFFIKTIFPQTNIDSLEHEFINVQDKHKKIQLGIALSRSYINTNKDSSEHYLKKVRLLLDSNPDTYLNAYYYQSLGNFHIQLFENDMAISYLKKSYNLYSSIDSTYDMAIVNTIIGNSFENLVNYDSSLYYYKLSTESVDSLTGASLIAANLNNMANVYKSSNDLNKALSCYLDALTIFRKMGEKENAAIALKNIGLLNSDEKIYSKAIEYIKQAIAINKELDNKYELCSCYNLLGVTNREQQNYDSALIYTSKALEIAEFLKYDYLIAQSNHNMGSIYIVMHDYRMALSYFQKSLNIVQKVGITEGEILNMINIGRVHTNMNNYSLANEFLFKALELCNEFNLTEYHQSLYFAITTNYEKWEKYNLSLEYYQLYSNVRDSLSNAERLNEIHSIQVQYETEQKELENQQLKSKNKLQEYQIFRQKLISIGFVIIIIIAILIIVMLVSMRRSRKKRITVLQAKNKKIKDQAKELTISNQAKDKLFSIISHDLRSPFTSLLGFSTLLLDESNAGNFTNTLTYSKHLNSVSVNTYELVDNLLNWSRCQQDSITMSPNWVNINETISELLMSHMSMAEAKQITINNNIDSNIEAFVDVNILMVIIRNLLSNATKFTPKGGKITIDCTTSSEKTIISIKDTGIGIEPNIIDKLFSENSGYTTPGTENEKGSGLGLMLVKDFTDKIGGTIWVDSIPDKGSTFSFTIPKAENHLL